MSDSYGTFSGAKTGPMPVYEKKDSLNSKRMVCGAFLILAVVALAALTSNGNGITQEMKLQEQKPIASGQVSRKQNALRSQVLDGEEGGLVEAGAETENTFFAVFGWHLTFAVLVIIGTIALWVHLRFVRPQSWFREWQKTVSSASDGFNAQTDGKAYLDENDITGSLTLVPGEAVFFNEEQALSFGGIFGSCSKLSVTNLRIIAQKSDTTCCGTCMLGANEDAWPIGNVTKVRLATGEFYGLTVHELISRVWTYFILTFSFDIAQNFFAGEGKGVIESAIPYPGVEAAFLTVLSCVGNLLVLVAIVYAVFAAVLLIWPHTLLKVYLTRKMEERSNLHPFSTPMESFTFQTKHSYQAYQAIFAAQSNAGTGAKLEAGAFNEIPAGVYTKATAKFVAAPK